MVLSVDNMHAFHVTIFFSSSFSERRHNNRPIPLSLPANIYRPTYRCNNSAHWWWIMSYSQHAALIIYLSASSQLSQCGNCGKGRGFNPPLNIFNSPSLVTIVYLSWGSDVTPTDRKNVKNNKFSSQHMYFRAQNAPKAVFGRCSAQDPAGELTMLPHTS